MGTNQLKLADIVVADTNSNISKAIKLCTNKKYVHSTLYVGNKRFLDSQKGVGFYKNPWYNYLTVDHIVLRDTSLTSNQRKEIVSRALKFNKKDYSFLQMLNLGLQYHFDKSFDTKYDKMACSDLVNYAYKYKFGERGKVMPWDFLEHEDLSIVYINTRHKRQIEANREHLIN